MANLVPRGIDAITGQSRELTSSDTLTDSSGTSVSSSSLPKRYIEGLEVVWSGTQTIDVKAGSCRNLANDGDITLASKTTADATTRHSAITGLAQINGIDEKGLDNLVSGSITCSQSATTITATGDVTAHYGTRAITGTITTSGTALTGSGTLFTEELSFGDLVGSSTTYGWSQVVAIASDTAATLIAALPGGSATSIAATVMHNATIQPNAAATDRVRTINAAGTAITVATSTTHAASSSLTIGVVTSDVAASTEPLWLAVWVIDDGATPATILSTQHEDLLALPSGYTSKRRVGWVFHGDTDTSGVRMGDLYYDSGGTHRYARFGHAISWLTPRGAAQIATNQWDEFTLSAGVGVAPAMPRTATKARFNLLHQVITSNVGNYTARIRVRGETGFISPSIQRESLIGRNTVDVDLYTDKAQYLEIYSAVPASGTGYVSLVSLGFYDDL
jgi:hypothetical protein